jgi:uncharacterized protein (UPF0264 family)
MSLPGGSPRGPATRLLASVRDAEEAALVAAIGPCILIDAKAPGEGALAPLPAPAVEAIVARVGGGAETSAVAGEPESWGDLLARVKRMAKTGIGMVKVAWPATGDPPPAEFASRLGRIRAPVVAVFFAETGPGWDAAERAARAGFSGAMIDTARKDGRTLLDHRSPAELAAFLAACRRLGLVAGLAGSLRLSDIAVLAPLGPSYLGFRGSLCAGGTRAGPIDPARVAQALSLIAASCQDAALA